MSRRPGPTNTLVDVEGLTVGHAQRTSDGWLSGVTVILAPADGAVASADVRGAAPGTRETDLLRPDAMVERVHAFVLSGGSAYGLASASGVADELGARGIGFRVGVDPGAVVPIVPAAVLFDLGRGGDFAARPGPTEGRAALLAASSGAVAMGTVGAGTGARAGGLKGGIGSASEVVDGWTVGALVAVNAAGNLVDEAGALLGIARGLAGEFEDAPTVDRAALDAIRTEVGAWSFNTTIGVVATDASLTKTQCLRLAGAGQDGVVRAMWPSHVMVDGDAIFAASTMAAPAPDDLHAFDRLLAVAADCVTRAIVHAMLAATSAGGLVSFRDLAAVGTAGSGPT